MLKVVGVTPYDNEIITTEEILQVIWDNHPYNKIYWKTGFTSKSRLLVRIDANTHRIVSVELPVIDKVYLKSSTYEEYGAVSNQAGIPVFDIAGWRFDPKKELQVVEEPQSLALYIHDSHVLLEIGEMGKLAACVTTAHSKFGLDGENRVLFIQLMELDKRTIENTKFFYIERRKNKG